MTDKPSYLTSKDEYNFNLIKSDLEEYFRTYYLKVGRADTLAWVTLYLVINGSNHRLDGEINLLLNPYEELARIKRTFAKDIATLWLIDNFEDGWDYLSGTGNIVGARLETND